LIAQGTPLAIITFSEDPPDEVLARVREQIEAGVKEEARIANRHNSPGGLVDSMKVYVVANAIIVDNDKAYAKYVKEGTAGRQLWNLIGKVIPLKLKSGSTIFRRVTEKALREGKWKIPAQPGKDFVRRGVQRAVAVSGGLMTRYGYELDEEVEEIWI